MRTEVEQTQDSLSPPARLLMRITAVLFSLLGVVLFLVPGWASPNFLWKVSPFVVMSMGGWYIGNGFMAWEVARVWKWGYVYPSMVLLWVFSLMEAGVLVAFGDKVLFNALLAWPYILTIVVAVVTTAVCVADWLRLRPSARTAAGGMSNAMLVGLVVFMLTVFVIAIFPLLGYGTSGTIFPEPISQFTLHAFGSFYLSISLGTIPLLVVRSLQATLFYARTGLALLYPITAAALVNIDKFDVDVHPGKIIYLSAYVIVGVAATILVWRYRTRTRRAGALSQA